MPEEGEADAEVADDEADDAVLVEVDEDDDTDAQGGRISGATAADEYDAEDAEELLPTEDLETVESTESGFRETPLGEGGVEEVTSSGDDPALMARAIRTVLKREE
jgi:hypothetical protein